MRIAVSNDHAGFPLEDAVVEHLRRLGHEVIDVGTDSDSPVDFPMMTQRVTDLIRSDGAERGVLVCGTGVGAAIAANKVPGIRAAVIHDTYVARQGVEHDDVNVACLGAWVVGLRIAEDALTAIVLRPGWYSLRVTACVRCSRSATKPLATERDGGIVLVEACR